MSPPTTHQSNDRGRRAVVFLRDGRMYEGAVSISGGFVHFEGRRRVRSGDDVTYRAAGGRAWPRRELKEIRYADSRQQRQAVEC
jgi:hypothetical protein